MNWVMINGTGDNAITYTAEEWFAFKPEERMRLIAHGHFTWKRI